LLPIPVGPPWVWLQGRYAFVNDKSNFGPFLEIQRDRWVAKVGNNYTTMSCSLTAMLDRPRGEYAASRSVSDGPPSPRLSRTRRADQSSTRGPGAGKPAPAPPIRALGPRQQYTAANPVHRGKTRAKGEGCTKSGVWAACSMIVSAQKTARRAMVFTIAPERKVHRWDAEPIHVMIRVLVVFREHHLEFP